MLHPGFESQVELAQPFCNHLDTRLARFPYNGWVMRSPTGVEEMPCRNAWKWTSGASRERGNTTGLMTDSRNATANT